MLTQLPLFCNPPADLVAMFPPSDTTKDTSRNVAGSEARDEAPPKMSPAVKGRAPRLTLARRADGWAVVGLEVELGPYLTRAEADDDRRGLRRFYEEL